jgi:hypothetical protein
MLWKGAWILRKAFENPKDVFLERLALRHLLCCRLPRNTDTARGLPLHSFFEDFSLVFLCTWG